MNELNKDLIRLFVSIPLTEEWVKLTAQIQEMNGDLKDVRWTRPENQHLTLLFIGDTPDIHINAIRDQIAVIADLQMNFNLDFENVTVAPNAKRPSMIWTKFVKNQVFTDFADKLTKVIADIHKFPTDNREVVPHLTLARFREFITDNQIQLPPRKDFHDLEVMNIDLMSSELTAEGPVHRLIQRYPLKGV